eukprot:g1634.t1
MKRIEPLRPFEPSIYSQVRRADVAGDLDGNPKGYGIVEFASPEEAQAAVEQLTGTDLLGRKGKETEKLRQKLILLCSFCFWVVFLLRLVVVGPFTGREIFVREDREDNKSSAARIASD